MDDLEQHLRSAHLALPSSEFEKRMESAFAAAERNALRTPRRNSWWLLAAAVASTGGMAALFVLTPGPASAPPPQAVVYQVEAQGRMRDMLVKPATTPEAPLAFVVQVSTP